MATKVLDAKPHNAKTTFTDCRGGYNENVHPFIFVCDHCPSTNCPSRSVSNPRELSSLGNFKQSQNVYPQIHEHSSTSTAVQHRSRNTDCVGVYGLKMSNSGQDRISPKAIKELFERGIGSRETCKNRYIYPEFYDKIRWEEVKSYSPAYQDKLREFVGNPSRLLPISSERKSAEGKAQKEGTRRKLPTETPQTLDSDCDPSAFDITVEGDQNHCSRVNMACGAFAFSSLRTDLGELAREHKGPTLNRRAVNGRPTKRLQILPHKGGERNRKKLEWKTDKKAIETLGPRHHL
ncbi:hypothetical protein NEUTE1DRAFT_113559 [Neurospora tetrasperma FGSC 2508]|uniref:Uncharacterized protein n=1 Tax=Neurospora tetrasperma (strain FGSC 2508 / ATCC MYA-4615 / P0657) TaxID=510951 RepID=F8MY03_NEUT8|nr:uncharacterized protein NEUTE1DRAFT_113559 [Neurospora tetrasperma FGSC 2508]EGO51485.1 hypothetical protein NEUTE1DRAFT_113559 [Neurospora tetrasperma FGSC 2508]EGZ78532.1 hypothetical protein NEUTE2DRAFT_125048 [Neurospora tetrasperma FGSC 2509]